VVPAQLVSRVDPTYPPVARQFHAEGNVVVNATVGADGRVKEAKAVSGNPMLREAAASAVRQWRYKPAILNGQPVESSVQVTLKFSAQ
jgi:protein TonB